MQTNFDVIVVGGGLAGLVNALQLSKAGLRILLIEKKQYPFHRVCGEYISNETLPFLASMGIFPHELGASRITQLQVTAPNGRAVLQMPLDLGGFGISRYTFDYHLYQQALRTGVTCLTGQGAEEITYHEHQFSVKLSDGTLHYAPLVVGSFGKRSKLDKQLGRPFMQQRSPYLGVKYHVRTEFPPDLIALHNFRDGYCGVCAIDDNTYNVCYLTTRDNLKRYGTIAEMEANTLYRNPYMRALRENATFLYEKPEVINEISFAPKNTVEGHLLMSGDTAGLITPLCGNGMAMAIHSAKILSELIIRYHREHHPRTWLEEQYTYRWRKVFARRLRTGRLVQQVFGNETVTSSAIRLLRAVQPAARYVMSQTHGKAF